MKRAIPTVITSPTTKAHRAARPIFSVSSASRETSPRTSRANAFSSRSSASIPAASSTVTNISERATDTATAKSLSGTLDPLSTVRLTVSGEPTERRTASVRPRLSMAIWAKLATCPSPCDWGSSGRAPRSPL